MCVQPKRWYRVYIPTYPSDENMLEFLIDIDQSLMLALNDMHSAYMDGFMMLFSGRWVWVPMYAAIFVAVLWRYGWRRGLLLSLAVGLAVTIADQTCATLLRPLAERLRPANLDNPLSTMVHIVDGYRGGQYGFPSCHAANTFALAAAVAVLLRRRGVVAFLYAWALVTCYSRIYLGVHYPGDLLVGAIVGTAAALLCVLTVRHYTHTLQVSKVQERWHELTPQRFVVGVGMAVIVALAIVAVF